MKLKIVILLSKIDQTGLTSNSLDLINGLINAEHDVFLIAGTNTKKELETTKHHQEQFKLSGAKIINFKTPKGSNFITKNINSVLSSLFILKQILKINPHVIHAESPYMSFLPWLLKRKFVSTLHINDLVKSFKYKNATHLIAISKETKEYAKKIFNYKDDDITVVHHGVSKNLTEEMSVIERNKFKQKNNLPTDKIIIGLVASIEHRKGHDLLLKAIEMLPIQDKEKLHLIFVGSSKDGRTNEWLNDLIQETNSETYTTRFGYQETKKFYDIIDIFVLPSRLEGFPLVVLEAMMSNCCVIRSNCEGASDQITHQKDGFIFEVNDYLTLSNILQKLLNDQEARKQIAKAGQDKALKYFTIEAMTEKTIKIYKNHIIN